MAINSTPPQGIDVAYTGPVYEVNVNSPLLLAVNMTASGKGIYRLTVVDSKRRVRGVLSGLRILDLIAGRRGEGIKRRAGKGFEPFLRQPIHLFVSEYLHKLASNIPLKGVISYIVENKVGHIVLVDQMNVLQGVITERCFLDRLPLKSFGINVSDLMTTQVYTVTPAHSLADAAIEMAAHGVRRLPILEDKRLRGVITVTDILKHLISSEYHVEAVLSKKDMSKFMLTPVKTIHTTSPHSLSPTDDISELLGLMKQGQDTGFPVVDPEGRLAGIVTSRDIVTKLPDAMGRDQFTQFISENVKKGSTDRHV